MRKTALALFIIMAIVIIAPWGSLAFGAGDDYEIEFKGKVGEDLDKVDVDQLLERISTLLENYKFSDDDVLSLTTATENFISTVNSYSKALKAAEPDKTIVAPHDELKEYCATLEAFMKKYKVTVEDTLKVGKAVAFVAMSIKEVKSEMNAGTSKTDENQKALATKEDIDAVFELLMEFSKKHDMMACDFIPVIYRLCDIGLTLMSNRVDLDNVKKSGGRWRKRLYDLGVSKEQADGLYDALVTFVHKYKISLREIIRLNKQINKLLKAS